MSGFPVLVGSLNGNISRLRWEMFPLEKISGAESRGSACKANSRNYVSWTWISVKRWAALCTDARSGWPLASI
jgi:hypothetical protein